ncbi:MAG: DUF4831 family protein [Bacteroidales bacterium]|jgi:hypothetical protein|nr:DUF4831 family protein [Bacteroidales bacterium]
MRKYILILALAAGFTAQAQTYRSFPIEQTSNNANGTYYTVPKTELVFDITLKKTIIHKGIFAKSAYLLGLKNVPLEDDTLYAVESIKIRPNSVPGKMYMLETNGTVSIEKNDIGALRSINKDNSNKKPIEFFVERHNRFEGIPKPVIPSICADKTASLPTKPIYETYFIKSGALEAAPDMTAEKVASLIKSLRESQIKMLSDGIDGTYMNTAIDFMYKQLDEIINGYVAMFAGVCDTETEHIKIRITPEKPIIAEEDLLIPICSFNEKQGIKVIPYSSANNTQIDNGTIVARLQSRNTTKQIAALLSSQSQNKELQDQIAKKGAGIYYAIPEIVDVSVDFGGLKVQKTINMMQFGVTTCTFSNNQSIEFDAENGIPSSIISK